MNLGTIQLDLLLGKDIPNTEFGNKLWEMGDGEIETIVSKSMIEIHLQDLKSDGEISEEWRIKHEPCQTYLQSIFDNMKTDYLFIK
jgi:hypothetical protein